MTKRPDPTGLPTDTYSAASATRAARPALSTNQKKMMSISAATLLLGGAMGLVMGGDKGTGHNTPGNSPSGAGQPSPINPPDDIDVASKVSDSMSFGHAFSTARDEVGMGGVFSWHGHWYNTFEKEEWTSLSLEQRQDYAEQITGEKLPVRQYTPHQDSASVATAQETSAEPTIIEGYINGQRVMGLDFDRDGIIDTMVMDGPDGHTYRVVDASGDERLDTMYNYDSLDGAMTAAIVLDQPFMLSNDDFSQSLESTMSKEVVDSILESDEPTESNADDDVDNDDMDDADDDEHGGDANDLNDTYVNNGDVHDMDA